MAFYFVTGKLGNGKTLCSVGRIRDKLQSGCIVASNVNLNLVAMCGPLAKTPRVIRVPDKPTAEDLHLLGNANPTYDESKNGLLVLDECGTWFNSRNWQDKARQALNGWFLHARKLGWDVLLIVQDISIIDSQARDALSEHTVFCRRLDNLNVPIFGSLFKAFTGSRLKLPRLHIAKVMYGTTEQDLLCDRWIYRGNDLFACYDTKQLFLSNYEDGVFSYLTPWHTTGRYQVPRDKEFYMRMTKIMWKRFKSPLAFAVGSLLGVSMAAAAAFGSAYHDMKIKSAQPVAAKHVEPEKSKELSATDKFYERIKKFRIDGALVVNGNPQYRFRDDSNDKGPVFFDTEKLMNAGVWVVPVNACQANLVYESRQATVYCL